MTVHRWFANKACPGDYLYNLHGQIAEEVNKGLKQEEDEDMTQETFNKLADNYFAVLAAKEGSDWSKEDRDWAVKAGLIKGDENGNYMWQSHITREQMVSILHRMEKE